MKKLLERFLPLGDHPDPMPSWAVGALAGTAIVADLGITLAREVSWWGAVVYVATALVVWIVMVLVMDRKLKLADGASIMLEQSWKRSLVAIALVTVAAIPLSYLLTMFFDAVQWSEEGRGMSLANLYLPWLAASCFNVLLKRRRTARASSTLPTAAP